MLDSHLQEKLNHQKIGKNKIDFCLQGNIAIKMAANLCLDIVHIKSLLDQERSKFIKVNTCTMCI